MMCKQIKCSNCGRVLMRLYSYNIKSVTCKCGHTMYFERDKESQEHLPRKKETKKK